MNHYVLDSCALIAYFRDEPGADLLKKLFAIVVVGWKGGFAHQKYPKDIYKKTTQAGERLAGFCWGLVLWWAEKR